MGVNHAKLCYIITKNSVEVSDAIISRLPRGVTLLSGTGMYTKLPSDVLLTCVTNKQLPKLKQLVKAADENAFVVVTSANEVYGKGFRSI